MKVKKKIDVYEVVTRRIREKLEEGIIPWRRPWGNKDAGFPMNLATMKPYRGVNALTLASEGKSAWWVTFHQAKMLGGSVNKGAKSVPVISYYVFEDEDEEELQFRVRYYNVFNVDDCTGIKVPVSPAKRQFKAIKKCEKFLAQLPVNTPPIRWVKRRAAYSWKHDEITIPAPSTFDSPEEYYATLFHELGHSTGHAMRLGRNIKRETKEEIGFEELVAELCAAFLCAQVGIVQKTLDQHTAYIQDWLQVLTEDPKAFVKAASAAQKASDYLNNVKFDDIARQARRARQAPSPAEETESSPAA